LDQTTVILERFADALEEGVASILVGAMDTEDITLRL
jgi:hypothetical protein